MPGLQEDDAAANEEVCPDVNRMNKHPRQATN